MELKCSLKPGLYLNRKWLYKAQISPFSKHPRYMLATPYDKHLTANETLVCFFSSSSSFFSKACASGMVKLSKVVLSKLVGKMNFLEMHLILFAWMTFMKSVFELRDQGPISRNSSLFVLFAEFWRTQQKPKNSIYNG